MADLNVWQKKSTRTPMSFTLRIHATLEKFIIPELSFKELKKKFEKLNIKKSIYCASSWSFQNIRLPWDKDDLVLTKLHALGFTCESVKVIHAYISNRFKVQKLILPIARLLQYLWCSILVSIMVRF